jgi:hypothetical protein
LDFRRDDQRGVDLLDDVFLGRFDGVVATWALDRSPSDGAVIAAEVFVLPPALTAVSAKEQTPEALITNHRAAQVVCVLLRPFATDTSDSQQHLYAVEGVLVYEWLVLAGVAFTVPVHDSRVIGVSEYVVDTCS